MENKQQEEENKMSIEQLHTLIDERIEKSVPKTKIIIGEVLIQSNQPSNEVAGLMIHLIENDSVKKYLKEFDTKMKKRVAMID